MAPRSPDMRKSPLALLAERPVRRWVSIRPDDCTPGFANRVVAGGVHPAEFAVAAFRETRFEMLTFNAKWHR